MDKEQARTAFRQYLAWQAIVHGVAWDEDVWFDGPMSGSAHYVSSETPERAPVILAPDGAGDYREHAVTRRSTGRLGF